MKVVIVEVVVIVVVVVIVAPVWRGACTFLVIQQRIRASEIVRIDTVGACLNNMGIAELGLEGGVARRIGFRNCEAGQKFGTDKKFLLLVSAGGSRIKIRVET